MLASFGFGYNQQKIKIGISKQPPIRTELTIGTSPKT
jgi:hypothetical protein